MRSVELQKLIEAVESRFGPVSSYAGDAEDGHGTSFTLRGVPATFSVHTQDGTLASGLYDIQIESYPPGEYIYTDVVALEALLELVAKVHGSEDQWPGVINRANKAIEPMR